MNSIHLSLKKSGTLIMAATFPLAGPTSGSSQSGPPIEEPGQYCATVRLRLTLNDLSSDLCDARMMCPSDIKYALPNDPRLSLSYTKWLVSRSFRVTSEEMLFTSLSQWFDERFGCDSKLTLSFTGGRIWNPYEEPSTHVQALQSITPR